VEKTVGSTSKGFAACIFDHWDPLAAAPAEDWQENFQVTPVRMEKNTVRLLGKKCEKYHEVNLTPNYYS